MDLPPMDRLSGRDVLFVMAVDAEYGPHLRGRIRPLMTGVGPVEAAVALSAALSRLHPAERVEAGLRFGGCFAADGHGSGCREDEREGACERGCEPDLCCHDHALRPRRGES